METGDSGRVWKVSRVGREQMLIVTLSCIILDVFQRKAVILQEEVSPRSFLSITSVFLTVANGTSARNWQCLAETNMTAVTMSSDRLCPSPDRTALLCFRMLISLSSRIKKKKQTHMQIIMYLIANSQ